MKVRKSFMGFFPKERIVKFLVQVLAIAPIACFFKQVVTTGVSSLTLLKCFFLSLVLRALFQSFFGIGNGFRAAFFIISAILGYVGESDPGTSMLPSGGGPNGDEAGPSNPAPSSSPLNTEGEREVELIPYFLKSGLLVRHLE